MCAPCVLYVEGLFFFLLFLKELNVHIFSWEWKQRFFTFQSPSLWRLRCLQEVTFPSLCLTLDTRLSNVYIEKYAVSPHFRSK